MSRTTKRDLRIMEAMINKILLDYGYNVRIKVEWAYGQPQTSLYNVNSGDQEGEISIRMSTGEMARWLDAYYKGLCLGLMENPHKEISSCVG